MTPAGFRLLFWPKQDVEWKLFSWPHTTFILSSADDLYYYFNLSFESLAHEYKVFWSNPPLHPPLRLLPHLASFPSQLMYLLLELLEPAQCHTCAGAGQFSRGCTPEETQYSASSSNHRGWKVLRWGWHFMGRLLYPYGKTMVLIFFLSFPLWAADPSEFRTHGMHAGCS